MSQKQKKQINKKLRTRKEHHIFFSNVSAIKNVTEPAWNYQVWDYDDGNGIDKKKNVRKQE